MVATARRTPGQFWTMTPSRILLPIKIEQRRALARGHGGRDGLCGEGSELVGDVGIGLQPGFMAVLGVDQVHRLALTRCREELAVARSALPAAPDPAYRSEEMEASISGNDGIKDIPPAIGAVDIAVTQGAALQHAKLVEQEDRVWCRRGQNSTLRRFDHLLGHLYSPVSRMWAHPRGEICARRSGKQFNPSRRRLATA